MKLYMMAIAAAGMMMASVYAAETERPARELLQRLVPDRSEEFILETIPPADGTNDVFEVDSKNGRVVLRGNNGVSQASAFNYYLHEYTESDVSWAGARIQLPKPLPLPASCVRRVSPYRYRYYLNYCTFNYTMSFWDWSRWEREIDWMALHGINLCLAMTGQEAVWRNTLQSWGVPPQTIQSFIAGPAFQAWWLMGNLEGWGGPVSNEWMDSRATLQMRILARERELGIEPVLQGFYGMVPCALTNAFPSARIVDTGKWWQFRRPAMLDPADPMFRKLAADWYREQSRLYGEARFYGGDPFHEGTVGGVDLTVAGRNIQMAMTNAIPGSIWVLQAWGGNPHSRLLAGLSPNHTLLLDLFGENNPQWDKRSSFGGFPWVWCVVSDFGGRVGLYGKLNVIRSGPPALLTNPARGAFCGLGAIMEGTEQNAPVYEYLFDLAWRTDAPSPEDWAANFARRRYGSANASAEAAWRLLASSAYGVPLEIRVEGPPESVFCARPSENVSRVSGYGTARRNYPTPDVVSAARLLAACSNEFGSVDAYCHDAVDITRQALSDLGMTYYQRMVAASTRNERAAFTAASQAFLDLITDQDQLLSTRREFRLGTWLQAARAAAVTTSEQDQWEWNARTLITVWGPRVPSEPDTLHEYSHREWAGLLSGFYRPRWQLYVQDRLARMDGQSPAAIDWLAWEEAWTRGHETYSAEPQGNALAEVGRVLKKYDSEFPRKLSATRGDYVGFWEYPAEGKTYMREFRADGAVCLYANGAMDSGWTGFTWTYDATHSTVDVINRNGKFELRHYLRDPHALMFVNEPWGPATKRQP